MSRLLFGMRAVERLAERYRASVESAAIHYVTLADVPCAVVWLEPDYDEDGFREPASPLRVRYQVRSHSFPFSIRRGTRVSLEDSLFWLCSEEERLVEGSIDGSYLGLEPGAELWVDCVSQGHAGAVLTLVCPAGVAQDCVVHEGWDEWE